jgi:hypothetical protein
MTYGSEFRKGNFPIELLLLDRWSPRAEGNEANEAVSVLHGGGVAAANFKRALKGPWFSFLSLVHARKSFRGKSAAELVRFSHALIRATPRVLTARAIPVPVRFRGRFGPVDAKRLKPSPRSPSPQRGRERQPLRETVKSHPRPMAAKRKSRDRGI